MKIICFSAEHGMASARTIIGTVGRLAGDGIVLIGYDRRIVDELVLTGHRVEVLPHMARPPAGAILVDPSRHVPGC